jgi:lipid II:glycine glycyltransferase (peptidoglycan interpeptide bridge formation enzyme)
MIAEFISTKDDRWFQILSLAPYDFYHLPQYIELSAEYEGGEPASFYAAMDGCAFLSPLLIQPVPPLFTGSEQCYDVKTPYGYPTPLLLPSTDTPALERFLEAFRSVCVERGIITAFFRLHPLIALPKEALARHGELIHHGQTAAIDLSLSHDEIRSQTRENHKRNIRKLQRGGFEVHMDRWEFFDEFIAIYEQTMERVGASETYFFPNHYFRGLRKALSDRLHLCTVLSPEGEVAAAGLFTTVGDIVEYHLGATANGFARQAPSKLMFDYVRYWAKEAGHRIFHLGGGVGCRADSLFEFKMGFSNLTMDFHTYRMVLDERKYMDVNRLWQKHFEQPVGASDFFPVYRHTPENKLGKVRESGA